MTPTAPPARGADIDAGFTEYAAEYPFDNRRWGLTIHARSWEEAEERLRRIGAFGRVIGSDVTAFPASMGWLAKLLVWWRNLRRQS